MESCWVFPKGHLQLPVVGRPNLRSKVLSASLYIAPQWANSAIAVLALTMTRVLRYVNFTSSVKDWESIALWNWPYYLCHCRGSQLYWDNFPSGSGSFRLLVMAPANALMRFAFSAVGAGGVGFSGLPQHNGAGAVWLYMGGIICVTKGGSMLFAVLNVFNWLIQVAAWLLLIFRGAVDCEMALLMAGLEVLGGGIEWKLLRIIALFITGFTFGGLCLGNRHKFRSGLWLRTSFDALGHGNGWAWGEFCGGIFKVGTCGAILDGITGN